MQQIYMKKMVRLNKRNSRKLGDPRVFSTTQISPILPKKDHIRIRKISKRPFKIHTVYSFWTQNLLWSNNS